MSTHKKSNDALAMATYVKSLQDHICSEIESQDTQTFQQDTWSRPGGGGGRTRVITGSTIEKGGVNVSEVEGQISKNEAPMFNSLLNKLDLPFTTSEGATFFATGISLVLHPKNPFVPTTHANYRYFEINLEGKQHWWFGGGADLTPYYLDKEDATHFHTTHKAACDKTDPAYYPEFKAWCDKYFYLPHRNEHRGIGGIFFDYLNKGDKEQLFNFAQDCGNAFTDAYIPIVKKHKDDAYQDHHKYWQELRRGRYVEFNLLYDRGTKFGLQTNGRIESILMSLPNTVRWDYCPEITPNSPENELIQAISKATDWV